MKGKKGRSSVIMYHTCNPFKFLTVRAVVMSSSNIYQPFNLVEDMHTQLEVRNCVDYEEQFHVLPVLQPDHSGIFANFSRAFLSCA